MDGLMYGVRCHYNAVSLIPNPYTCLMRLGKSYLKHINFIICLAQSLQNHVYSPCLIKSPQYTGGDFMFLYRFVRRRRRRRRRRRPLPAPAADSCSRDNFWTTFWISFIFGTIVGPDLQITWLHFRRFSSWPWPRFFKVKYGICYISAKKWSDCHETKSKHIN